MNQREILDYYSRDDVKAAMLKVAKDREITGVYANGSFGSRPNVLLYPTDITSLAKTGVLEFHSSLERWENPMGLRSDNMDSLRIGWDIILDLDCELFEHGKIAAKAFMWGLKKHGIENFSIKFTGGTGFHIGIPWESIPEKINFQESSRLFPSLARQIGLYLREFVREYFESQLLNAYKPQELAKQVGLGLENIVTDTGIDPFKIVEVDPVLIAPRHLFRMPYSINKNTFLVSLPIRPEKLEEFQKDDSRPEKIKADLGFLGNAEKNEAALLATEAMDWYAKRRREKEAARERIEYTKSIKPDLFPPCMQSISEGLTDGRKRSVFILINFLRSVKWKWEDIEKYLESWNQRNNPPLPDSYVRSQLLHGKNRKEALPPPNCVNEAYYPAFGVCKPDHICTRGTGQIVIKNPVNYPFLKMRTNKQKRNRKRMAKE